MARSIADLVREDADEKFNGKKKPERKGKPVDMPGVTIPESDKKKSHSQDPGFWAKWMKPGGLHSPYNEDTPKKPHSTAWEEWVLPGFKKAMTSEGLESPYTKDDPRFNKKSEDDSTTSLPEGEWNAPDYMKPEKKPIDTPWDPWTTRKKEGWNPGVFGEGLPDGDTGDTGDMPPNLGTSGDVGDAYDIRTKFPKIGMKQRTVSTFSGQPAWEPKRAPYEQDLLGLALYSDGVNALRNPQTANAGIIATAGMQMHTLEQDRLNRARPEVLPTTNTQEVYSEGSEQDEPTFGWYQDSQGRSTGAIAHNGDGSYTVRSGGHQSTINKDSLSNIISYIDPSLDLDGDTEGSINRLNEILAPSGMKIFTDRNGNINVTQLPGDYLVSDPKAAATAMQIYEAILNSGTGQPVQQNAQLVAAQNEMMNSQY